MRRHSGIQCEGIECWASCDTERRPPALPNGDDQFPSGAVSDKECSGEAGWGRAILASGCWIVMVGLRSHTIP